REAHPADLDLVAGARGEARAFNKCIAVRRIKQRRGGIVAGPERPGDGDGADQGFTHRLRRGGARRMRPGRLAAELGRSGKFADGVKKLRDDARDISLSHPHPRTVSPPTPLAPIWASRRKTKLIRVL